MATVALLVLQRLRPQPAQRVVATTQFWSAAMRSQQQRTLWGRLGRWRSFVAVLACLLLLAGALTGWTRTARDATIFVIDTGVTMNAAHDGRTRQAEAVAALEADLTRLGGTPVTVLTAGESPQVLDAAGQPAALLRPAVRQIGPSTRPAASAAALRTAAALLPGGRGRVVWYTDRSAPPADLPADVAALIETRTLGTSAVNSAITAAVFVGDPDAPSRGTIRVTTTTWGTPRPLMSVRFSGPGLATTDVPLDEANAAMLPGMAADGRTVAIDLIGDSTGLDADDHATLTLPRRGPVRFVSGATLDEPLRIALESFGTISATGTADIRIVDEATAGAADGNINDALPVLRIVRSGGPVGVDVGVAVDPRAVTIADLHFEHAVAGMGVDVSVPAATPLVRAGPSVLAAATGGDRPQLRLSAALWTPPSTVPKRAAFVVLLERACRELISHDDAQMTTLAFNTGANGDLRLDDRRPPLALGSASAARWQPWELLLVLAVGALSVEGVLHAKRKIV